MKEQIGDWNTLSNGEKLEQIIHRVNHPIKYNPLDDLEQWEIVVEWLEDTFELSGGEVYGNYTLDWDDLPTGMKNKNSPSYWGGLTPYRQFIELEVYWEDYIDKRRLREKPGRKPKIDPREKKKIVAEKYKPIIEAFSYDPETGKIRRVGAMDIDCEYIANGCMNIWHNGRRYPSHHIAVKLMRKTIDGGKIEKGTRIIHINGDRFDNRWVNLKIIPPYLKHERIYTRFRHEGIIVNLGYVDTLEERAQRIEHYRGLRAIGVDHETAVRESKNGLK